MLENIEISVKEKETHTTVRFTYKFDGVTYGRTVKLDAYSDIQDVVRALNLMLNQTISAHNKNYGKKEN